MKKIVLIGDIVKSKFIKDRALTQKMLKKVHDELNNRDNPYLISHYSITLGDEFQAVFNKADTLFYDALLILLTLHPVKTRFSFGIGTIETPIMTDTPFGMDGPAFYNARRGIEELKRGRYLFNISGLDITQTNLPIQALHLISHNFLKWNKIRYQVLVMMYQNLSVKEISEKIQISDKAVYKTINVGALRIVIQLFEEIIKIINKNLELE